MIHPERTEEARMSDAEKKQRSQVVKLLHLAELQEAAVARLSPHYDHLVEIFLHLHNRNPAPLVGRQVQLVESALALVLGQVAVYLENHEDQCDDERPR